MPKLIIKNGEKAGLEIRLTDSSLLIGRDPSNHVVLPDRRASRQHVSITRQNEKFILEDLGSVNGTKVNQEPISKHALQEGDEVLIGATVLVYSPSHANLDDVSGEMSQSRVNIFKEHHTSRGMTVEMKIPSDVPVEASESFKAEAGSAFKDAYERLITLYRISNDLSRVTEVRQLLNQILSIVLEVMKADRGFIMLIDEETQELSLPVIKRKKGLDERDEISISRTIIDQVLESKESLLITDALKDERFAQAESIVHHGIRSTMCVPLKVKEKLLGLMHIDSMGVAVKFKREDLELLTAICSQAAVAIENAKLFDNLRSLNIALKEQQAQLIEAEKLSALGCLAGGVAHEINNPMTSILGYSELAGRILAKGQLDTEEIKECAQFVKVVEDEAQQCKRIAQTLLQFGHRKKEEKELTEINEVVEAALLVAQFHIKKVRIDIVKDLAEGLPQVMADRGQLQQVFLNFIINARDAMEGGGTLTITTSLSDGQEQVRIVFTDTGCGIPKDKLEEIFKPLYTSKPEGKGTGLGLSISQDIIEKHEGNIDVKSAIGQGTTFTITLPVAEER